MNQLMADAVSPWLIPPTISHAAAYSNGDYAWTDDQVDRFAGHVKIGVLPGQPAQAVTARVLDIERYDATPADAVPFVRERLAQGKDDATLYCNRATLPVTAAMLALAGITDVRWWVATLDGTTVVHVPFGTLWAVQFTTVAGAYDLSIVYGPFDWAAG